MASVVAPRFIQGDHVTQKLAEHESVLGGDDSGVWGQVGQQPRVLIEQFARLAASSGAAALARGLGFRHGEFLGSGVCMIRIGH